MSIHSPTAVSAAHPHIRCALAALCLISALASSATATNYDTGGTFDVGNGIVVMNWYASPFNVGWANTAVNSSSNFSIQWDISNYGFLHRVGKNTFWKPVDSCNAGTVANYTHDMTAWRSNSDGYTGLYGWLSNYPQPWTTGIEWYIVEDWMQWAPWPGSANWKGNITVDGAIYDIYNVKGGAYGSWNQWWSIRKSKRASGNISYIKHFQKWRQLGMPNRTVNDVAFFLEPQGGSTSGIVYYSSFRIDAP